MKHFSFRRKESGFTLIEIMIVIVIVPILFMAVYTVLESSNVIFRTNGVFSQLNQSAMQTLRYISREIGQTSPNLSPNHLTITADAGNNHIVTFQIPVDCDNDGDAVDDEGLSCVQDLDTTKDTEWGAYPQAGQVQNGTLGAWARYSLVNGQLIRQVLDSSLSPIAGFERVVANNVQSFTVTQNLNTVTMTLNLNATDTIGQMGKPRNYQTTFTSNTILRNAVT